MYSHVFTQSRLIALLLSLIDNGWSCIRLNDGPNIKLVELFKLLDLDLEVAVAWLPGVTMRFFCRVLISGSS